MSDEREVYVGGQKPKPASELPDQYIDREFQVPTEIIALPSNGIFYPGNQKTVKIKYMTADAEDILYSSDLINSGKVLDVILKEGVIDSGGISVDDMVSGDRNQILLELRKTGLGSEYSPGKMKCPSCKENHEPTINLDDVKLKECGDDPDAEGWFSVMLPVSKKNIKFRFMNGSDEKALSAKPKNVPGVKNALKYSKFITERYLRQIMEVDGTREKGYIKKFISVMPLKDSAFLREYIKGIEPGLDTNMTIECDKCGHVYETDLTLNPIKLFYPDAKMDE